MDCNDWRGYWFLLLLYWNGWIHALVHSEYDRLRQTSSSFEIKNLEVLSNSVEIAKKIVQKKLSVRQSEILVRQFRDKKFKLVTKKDSNILDLQKDLEEKTGLSVSINNKKNNSGVISFEYRDLDQLEKLIDTIKKNY